MLGEGGLEPALSLWILNQQSNQFRSQGSIKIYAAVIPPPFFKFLGNMIKRSTLFFTPSGFSFLKSWWSRCFIVSVRAHVYSTYIAMQISLYHTTVITIDESTNAQKGWFTQYFPCSFHLFADCLRLHQNYKTCFHSRMRNCHRIMQC